jgi:predicted deacylase
MKKVREKFMIGGVEIRPGQRKTIDLTLPRLYTHARMIMPVQVYRGKEEGPRLFVSATIHGDELNGVEIIRRLMRLRVLRKMRGTLLAVPVVNVYGFFNRSRYLPDRRDLNRSFPGSLRGSLTARLARLFMDEIVKKSTHGIDIHTGANNRSNLPQIRACMDDRETARLAHAFGIPFILNANVRDGSLREAVRHLGIPVLVYEGGEALRFDEATIRMGLKGILSVMRAIGMLPAALRQRPSVRTLVARSSLWVRAPLGGIFRVAEPLGSHVEKDAILGWIGDSVGENVVEVRAPFSGLVIGRTNMPLVNEGDPLYHVASYKLSHSVSILPKKSHTELDPDLVTGTNAGSVHE